MHIISYNNITQTFETVTRIWKNKCRTFIYLLLLFLSCYESGSSWPSRINLDCCYFGFRNIVLYLFAPCLKFYWAAGEGSACIYNMQDCACIWTNQAFLRKPTQIFFCVVFFKYTSLWSTCYKLNWIESNVAIVQWNLLAKHKSNYTTQFTQNSDFYEIMYHILWKFHCFWNKRLATFVIKLLFDYVGTQSQLRHTYYETKVINMITRYLQFCLVVATENTKDSLQLTTIRLETIQK